MFGTLGVLLKARCAALILRCAPSFTDQGCSHVSQLAERRYTLNLVRRQLPKLEPWKEGAGHGLTKPLHGGVGRCVSLYNAFTSAFKDLDPIPQFRATAKLGSFLDTCFKRSF